MAKVRIIGLAMGQESSLDGRWLVEYDPGRDGVAPDGEPMRAHIVTTDKVEDALDLEFKEMWALVNTPDPRDPFRPDGNANRPITAFHLEYMST